ncbi:Non-specific serine/threonine protein kinase [Micromonospora saelicesensis]|uniref:non-specific serine/threonine protein kinase n=1 Tax=Micromonospora saelicesensis TaxID=285676 RepID=A0A328NN77_9ACTN|nr:serine/threonine-protein kinase [Micromonospora saelicesensis]RAO34189.1 Non-specific serine/threonine protein kinase [Micromonospora saelicesensis]
MSPFTPTLRLHDRYVLHERIGLGGMSEVWRGEDEVLGRPVAIKVLAGQFATDPQLRATIQREARAAARLTHPHVTQVYDYAEATLAGGVVVPYLVMELVDGHNLADRLRTGPLPWPEAVRVAGQIAAALAAAHRIGVVHRDVKPGNVMLTDTGAKVLDFGIAALGGLDSQSGEPLMGTPAYFAPERLTAGPPDPASDVYALGALLYRTLTGQAPLPVQSWEDALEVHRRGTPVPPLRVPGLPADIAELTVACLAANPADRPSAAHLARRFGAGQPVEPPTELLRVRPAAHPPTLIDRSVVARPVPATAAPARRRSRRPLAALVAAVLAMLIGVGVLLAEDPFGNPGTPDPAEIAAAPSTSAPAPAPTTHSPTPTAPSSPPAASTAPSTVGQQLPVSFREVSSEFAAVLATAVARGDVEPKTAEDLRDDLADLNRRTRDRADRVADLRDHIAELVRRDRLPAQTGAKLDALLARADTFSTSRTDD